MKGNVNRRTLIKGAAGAVAAVPAIKASKTFAAPAVIQDTSSDTKIVYWGSFEDGSANGEAEQGVVDQFNAAGLGVQVERQYQGNYEDTAQKLTAAVAAKQTPDVSLLSDVWWFRFYLNSLLAPLNDLIAASELDTTDYVDSLINEGNRDGIQYWMPMARSTPLFYYNVEAFNEVGLTEAPTNWSQIVDVAQDLVRKDGDTVTRAAFVHPSAGSYIAWLFQCVTWQYEGRYSDEEFNIMINQAEAVEAGEFYRSSVADGWAVPVEVVRTDFINGLTASMMASTGDLGAVTREATFEFKTAFLPEAKTFGCCTGGSGLAILADKSPEQQAAAFEFIKFATSPETTSFWSQNTGYMPVRKSARENETMVKFFEENPNFKTAVDQLELTKPQDSARVFIPNGDQIIGGGLEKITINKTDAQSAFDEVAAILEEEKVPVLEALEALQG
ncbi:MAG: ABC transporter substrate-binding protein [Thermomicrobiales bacterium]